MTLGEIEPYLLLDWAFRYLCLLGFVTGSREKYSIRGFGRKKPQELQSKSKLLFVIRMKRGLKKAITS